MNNILHQIALEVFNKYKTAYDGEVQGCCLLIADEIQKETGGKLVAGELTWYGGSCKRTHWWVEVDGITLDPMGDELLKIEDYPGRVKIHTDSRIFYKLLPDYERWRVVDETSNK